MEIDQLMELLREPDEDLVTALAWDIYDDRESIKKQVRQVLHALVNYLEDR